VLRMVMRKSSSINGSRPLFTWSSIFHRVNGHVPTPHWFVMLANLQGVPEGMKIAFRIYLTDGILLVYFGGDIQRTKLTTLYR
jgi:hypothetical protein